MAAIYVAKRLISERKNTLVENRNIFPKIIKKFLERGTIKIIKLKK